MGAKVGRDRLLLAVRPIPSYTVVSALCVLGLVSGLGALMTRHLTERMLVRDGQVTAAFVRPQAGRDGAAMVRRSAGTGNRDPVDALFEEVPPVRGDPTELREVFTNLILNAVDAMPGGGMMSYARGSTAPASA